MVTVNIEEEDLLNMLLDRLEYWTTDNEVMHLYEGYYQELINAGVF